MTKYISKEEIEIAMKTEKAKIAAQIAFPQWVTSDAKAVAVPGWYDVYAVGTAHDVTVLIWINNSGEAKCHAVIW